MAGRDIDEQRLAFGRVARLYDRARPSYPPAAVDGICEFAGLEPGARVLEVGAGTGKGTRLLAERGLAVTALEPDPEMIAIARRNCEGFPGVEFLQASFEQWRPQRRVQAVVSFQAWHWVDPSAGYELAAQALGDGGTLAAIWTFPHWPATALRDELRAAYSRGAPGLAADFAMHPASRPHRVQSWRQGIAASRFSHERVQEYPWAASYSAAEYCELLQTHQDHILMEPGERDALLGAVGEAVKAAGGIELQLITHVCLARLA